MYKCANGLSGFEFCGAVPGYATPGLKSALSIKRGEKEVTSMKLHLSVPSLCRSRCSLRWIWIPEEFTLNLAVNPSVRQATRLCPDAGTGVPFAPGAVACHKLANGILAVTLSA